MINHLLQGKSLYNEQRFGWIELKETTQKLIAQNPQGKDLIYLNRLLLEEAYPNEIAKSRSITVLDILTDAFYREKVLIISLGTVDDQQAHLPKSLPW